MKFTCFLLLFANAWFFHGRVFAQQSTEVEDFQPYGDPIIRVFANVHGGLTDEDRNSAFELSRAYLGYEYQLTKNFYTQVKLDIGSPDDLSEFSRIRRYAYFKNAMVRYSTGGLRVDFGLIDMQHFKLQERFWGHRYVEKSYIDRFRMGSSADLGVAAIYDFNEYLSVDATVSNGEGYSNLQRDNTLKGALGITAKPWQGLALRVYGDIMDKSVDEITLSTFIGYNYKKKARLGVEYNHKFNNDFAEGRDYFGCSVSGAVKLPLDLELFGRYDWVSSNIPEGASIPWQLGADGSSVIAGIQYSPVEYVKLALDYQDWYPRAANEPNRAYIFLNVELKY